MESVLYLCAHTDSDTTVSITHHFIVVGRQLTES